MINFRIGQGYDIHRLEKNRRLVLGGIEIKHDLGLVGHSDADIAIHSIIDALLGAAALGDIGTHFPDNCQEYKDADSGELLREVVKILDDHDWEVGNVDITIIAQKPMLKPYIKRIRQNLAALIGVEESRISVKAKTNEGVGEIGDEKAMASHAVALIYKK